MHFTTFLSFPTDFCFEFRRIMFCFTCLSAFSIHFVFFFFNFALNIWIWLWWFENQASSCFYLLEVKILTFAMGEIRNNLEWTADKHIFFSYFTSIKTVIKFRKPSKSRKIKLFDILEGPFHKILKTKYKKLAERPYLITAHTAQNLRKNINFVRISWGVFENKNFFYAINECPWFLLSVL